MPEVGKPATRANHTRKRGIVRETQLGQSIRLTRQVLKTGSTEGLTYSAHYRPWVAWFYWAFGGIFGLHRLYLGEVGRPILMALTLGGVGVWWIIDAFLLPGKIRELNSRQYAASVQYGI